jgi:hypothetical protein
MPRDHTIAARERLAANLARIEATYRHGKKAGDVARDRAHERAAQLDEEAAALAKQIGHDPRTWTDEDADALERLHAERAKIERLTHRRG